MKKTHSACRKLSLHVTLLLFICLILTVSCRDNGSAPFNESAQAALSTFTLEPGFKIELIVSEPLVMDPVAMEIDENGRMYVVEMPGYPLDVSGSGKIKLLTDSDGDGKMDKSVVFADRLLVPTGIMRWKKGVLVTDPPNVLYFEDTDLDGRADVRDTVLTGFAVSNPSHIVNQPMYGLDNWIYLANDPAVTTNVYVEEFGDRGKEIIFAGKENSPRLPQNANGRNVRFRPDQLQLQLLSSKSQFGHSFDSWGHYFTVNNSNHVTQEVIHAEYLTRNPDLIVSDVIQSLSDHGNASEVFPTTINPELQMLTNVGVITSACGLTVYQGDAFPSQYNTDISFVAEPVSNLIHVDKLTEKGATFNASRIREKKEFLTSTDAWFRPVYTYIGPDGALYVVDYYRRIIEHPEFMSDEVNESGTLYDGKDKGRIYRISATDAAAISWTKEGSLRNLSPAELVEKLADGNIWWRKHAQRILVDRADAKVLPALIKMTQNAESSLGRLHALWTLEGIGKLESQQIKEALKDAAAGVRENAIKLAELHLDDDPSLANDLLALKGDGDPKVKFQLICTLGYLSSSEADEVRQDLLFENIGDPWMQIAALSAPSSHKRGLLDAVLKKSSGEEPAYASLVQRLSTMAGASQEARTIHRLIVRATNPAVLEKWQGPMLEGLAQGLKSKMHDPSFFTQERRLLVRAFFDHKSASVRKGSLRVLQAIGLGDDAAAQSPMSRAHAVASDKKTPAEQRAEALDFLALRNPAPFASSLKGMIVTGEDLSVQASAINTLSAIPDQTVSTYILERWESLTPDLRDVALNTFFTDKARIEILLDAIEKEKISRSSVGFYRSVRLMVQSDVPLRNRARKLFNQENTDRKETIRQYQASLDLNGNDSNGEKVFEKNCASCHQVRGTIGTSYGPDLGTVHNWPPSDLLVNILDPNRSISDGFDVWEVTLNTDHVLQGIISTETPNALTIINAGGQETLIARTDIKSLKTLGVSTMPAGLEAQIDLQGMADLLAFLKKVE